MRHQTDETFAFECDIRNAHLAVGPLAGSLLTAHEDERSHLARELRDDLTQRLVRLAIDARRREIAVDWVSLADGRLTDAMMNSPDESIAKIVSDTFAK